MATDAKLETPQNAQPNVAEAGKSPALDPANTEIVIPKQNERVAAQIDHHVDPHLCQAGYSERERMAVVLVTANKCLQQGAENVDFAGYNKAANSVVVQISGQNVSNVMVCVNVIEACKANPVEELAKMQAELQQKNSVIAEKDKLIAEKEKENEQLKTQLAETQKKEQEQAQQAKAQTEPAKTAGTSTSGDSEEKGGFFSWLGKAIDNFREKVQKFVKEFIEHPFETIGRIVDCALGYGRHNEQPAKETANQQQEQAQTQAQPVQAAAMRH